MILNENLSLLLRKWIELVSARYSFLQFNKLKQNSANQHFSERKFRCYISLAYVAVQARVDFTRRFILM